MFEGYIYKITNTINGKAYIGQTTNLQKRWYQHRNGYGSKILTKAFIKYGISNFEFEQIIKISSKDRENLRFILNTLEVLYIKKYNTFKKGYNATVGGEGTSGYKMNEQAIQNLRESHIGYIPTEEQRTKIGNALRGRTRDEEMIAKAALKRRKPILQYSLDGEFIREFEGITFVEFDAANILMCCKGKINSAYGYIWRYKTSVDFPRNIEVQGRFNIKNKKVIQYTKDRQYMNTYNNIKEASMITGISVSSIRNCICGTSKSAGGYMWNYVEEGGSL